MGAKGEGPRAAREGAGGVNLTASERRWFYWALLFAVLVGVVIGLGTADWMVYAL